MVQVAFQKKLDEIGGKKSQFRRLKLTYLEQNSSLFVNSVIDPLGKYVTIIYSYSVPSYINLVTSAETNWTMITAVAAPIVHFAL